MHSTGTIANVWGRGKKAPKPKSRGHLIAEHNSLARWVMNRVGSPEGVHPQLE